MASGPTPSTKRAASRRRNPRTWGSVDKLPSGRWRARTGPDPLTNRRITLGTFERKADADAVLAQAREQQRTGAFVAPKASRVTFAEAADRWSQARLVRPSTGARDDAYLASLILPHLGPLELGRIDPSVLRGWLAELSRQGKAPSTIVKASQIAGMILSQAAVDRLIVANPMTLVDLPRIPPSRRRALSDDEVGALVATIDERDRAMVLVCAFCALRPGEAVALRCSQLNLMTRTLSVVETASYVSGKLTVGPPKTKASVRTIPVPAPLAGVLEQHLAALGLRGDDLVFPGPGGGHIRMNNWQRRHWFPAFERTGIEPIAVHQLRHTGITRWVQAGLDLVTVARRAGHESVRTVADIYARAIEGETAADALIADRAAAVIAAATKSAQAGSAVTDLNWRRQTKGNR